MSYRRGLFCCKTMFGPLIHSFTFKSDEYHLCISDIDYGNYGGIGGRAPNVGQQGVNKTASQKDTAPKSAAKEDAQLTQLTILNRLVREQQKATDCYVSFFQQRLVDLKRRVDKLGKKPKKSKKRKYSIEDYVEFNPSISEKEEDGGGSDLNPVPRLKRTKHKRNRY